MAKKLTLSINPDQWGYFYRRKTDQGFQAFQQKVFDRDRYTCQYCGFVARESLEVINGDGNYRNNKLSNMATACPFCAQCLFLQNIGQVNFNGGKLIYLPEMEQQELNALCHVLFCAITNGTGYRDMAQNIYRMFKLRIKPVEEKYGENASEPGFFSQLLIEQSDVVAEKASIVFRDIRLLPSYSKFKKQLQRWAELAAEEMQEQ